MVSMDAQGRTSLLIRCSPQDAQTIHAEALAQHRSVSGYLLNVLERSIWIEERSQVGLSYTIKIAPPDASEGRTAIHLRCTVEQADGIRKAAKRRLSSISSFVVFSLRRQWRAAEQIRNSGLLFQT
ncbi:MAG TPA: hypothetical protein VN727_02140 [Candidatus Binatia bacterium]|nr:hypothetical protein [Candidatus Binatia bacterium]